MPKTTPLLRALYATTFLLLATTALTGCAAGPDFKKPDAPTVTSYGPDGLPKETDAASGPLGGMQRFEANGDVPAAWWTLYESAALSHMIDQAIKGSPTLDSARASLRNAQETALASEGGLFPSLTGSASDDRSKSSGKIKPYTVYGTSVAVSYAPDIFGETRRTIESKDAAAEAANFELEAAYLTLTSNVVTTAVTEASLREQIAATKDILEAEKKQLDLTRKKLEAGAVAQSAVLSQESTVAATEATLPSLENLLAQSRHSLAVLMGRFPSEGTDALFTLSGLKLPEKIPVSLPSQLVDQRPDIRMALAALKAANANVGVATAAMLPQFTLTGNYGVGAAKMSDMFTPTTAVWGLAAGLTQPIFKGGELLHTKRAAQAAFDKAAADYRATVLSAFQDVANALKALETDAQALKAQAAAERSAKQNLDLVTQQFNAGAVDYITLLSAQASYQSAKINLVKAEAARLSDTAALFQALGGGWWNRQVPLVSQP